MTIIENWDHVLLKAWSVRWLLIGNLLGVLPMLFDGLASYVTPQQALVLTLISNMAALAARFIKQDNLQAPAETTTDAGR